MSEPNLIEQLKAAANEPVQSVEEYKAERANEGSNIGNQRTEKYDDRPRPYEKELAETKEVEEKVEIEYRPWETKEVEEKELTEEDDEDVIVTDADKKVPLHKLLKLKAQKKEREVELERYKAQVAEYESVIKKNLPKEEAEVVIDPIEQKLKSLKQPDASDYDDYYTYKKDDDEYKAKLKEIEEERIVTRVENNFKQKHLAEQQLVENSKKTEAFVTKIEEASKSNPEIKSAIGWFEQNIIKNGGLTAIHPNVQQALVQDDNAPELIYRVVKDKDLIESIFSKSNTVDVLKKIGKIAAYIELEKEGEDEVTEKPNRVKSVPRVLSGSSGGNIKSSTKAESMEEYKKLRAKEAELERKNKRR